MSAPLRRFPDVQRALVGQLELLVGAGHVGIETPPNLAQVLPFVRVQRIGGGSDRLNDIAGVDIDTFEARYTAAEALAEAIRQYLVGPPPPVVRFDRITCEVGPRELPWGDGTMRRFGASYTITSRRHTAP